MSSQHIIIFALAMLAIYLWRKKNYIKGEIRKVSIEEADITALIKSNLDQILIYLGIHRSFEVKLHRRRTYTLDNKTIYIKPGCNGEIYNVNTLMKTAIHELAHVLTKSMYSNRMHDDEFIRTEEVLESTAVSLNLYDPYQIFSYEDTCSY